VLNPSRLATASRRRSGLKGA